MLRRTDHGRLTRSRAGLLGGVAEGLGQAWGISPWLIRLVWLGAVFAYGTGIFFYLILWWLMPAEDAVPFEPAVWERHDGGARPPLVRTRVDKKILGVCGGLARRWHLDPTLVRLGALTLLALSAGVAIIAYLVAAVFIPGADGRKRKTHPVPF